MKALINFHGWYTSFLLVLHINSFPSSEREVSTIIQPQHDFKEAKILEWRTASHVLIKVNLLFTFLNHQFFFSNLLLLMLMDIDDRISLILFEQASKFIDFDAYAQTHIIVTNSPRNI